MKILVIEVEIDPSRQDEQQRVLNESIVPGTVASKGFVKGVWIQSADLASGKAVMWFEQADDAQALIDEIEATPQDPAAPVVIRSTGIYDIAAEA